MGRVLILRLLLELVVVAKLACDTGCLIGLTSWTRGSNIAANGATVDVLLVF